MIRIRTMTRDDVPLGMRLKQAAGWNQTETDWLRYLAMEPEGCFVAEREGQPVGTTTTCTFGSVAWIAMVLVDAAVRGQGIGTALMTHALEWLDGRGVRSVRLDATSLGRPIYERLGFVAQFELARYEGILPATDEKAFAEPVRPEQLGDLVQLDTEITRTDRRALLLRLYHEWPEAMVCVQAKGRLTGYLGARRGARALFIGPCLADDEAGPLLFAEAWRQHAGQAAYIDIPVENAAAVALARAEGLTVQRPLLRMCRGEEVRERVEHLWASSGPEMG